MSTTDHELFPVFKVTDAIGGGGKEIRVSMENRLPSFEPPPMTISLCLTFLRCKMGIIIVPLEQCLVIVTVV